MTVEDDKKGEEGRKNESKPNFHKTESAKDVTDIESSLESSRRQRLPSSNVGDALKSAYQRTLDENIPPEMLDLLGKLG